MDLLWISKFDTKLITPVSSRCWGCWPKLLIFLQSTLKASSEWNYLCRCFWTTKKSSVIRDQCIFQCSQKVSHECGAWCMSWLILKQNVWIIILCCYQISALLVIKDFIKPLKSQDIISSDFLKTSTHIMKLISMHAFTRKSCFCVTLDVCAK